MKALVSELRAEHKRNEPPEEPDEGQLVAKLIDKPLCKLGSVKVPICGVRIGATQVFQVAEALGHPLYSECRSFIERNRLILRSVPSARGRPATVVMQEAR